MDFNQFYNPYGTPQYYQPRMVQQPQQQPNNGITWVQGESGAKSYIATPGVPALLMDSENPVFYIKTTDQSGMPLPLRIFDYKERNAAVVEQKQQDFAPMS